MQASLDLADQGFKVYLVEASSAVGGKMAQLDKTFPTNDCAMCTISPRLVETGRHTNIQLLTKSEVMEVKGQSGDFSVRLRHHPRYVDPSKCVACGDCTAACPVLVPDTFNENLAKASSDLQTLPAGGPKMPSPLKNAVSPPAGMPAHPGSAPRVTSP